MQPARNSTLSKTPLYLEAEAPPRNAPDVSSSVAGKSSQPTVDILETKAGGAPPIQQSFILKISRDRYGKIKRQILTSAYLGRLECKIEDRGGWFTKTMAITVRGDAENVKLLVETFQRIAGGDNIPPRD